MNNYQHIIIKIRTLSYCIVSPRDTQAFYKDVDFDGDSIVGREYSVIYPFYQFGTYEKYDHDTARYYLPGSTLKGTLFQDLKRRAKRSGNEQDKAWEARSKVMVDDYEIANCDIVLKTMDKYQFLGRDEKQKANVNKKVKYGPFFQNVGFQMLKPAVEIQADIYVDSSLIIGNRIQHVDNYTRSKLKKYSEYLVNRTKSAEFNLDSQIKEQISMQENAINKLLSSGKTLMSLGGYKGMIRSLNAIIVGDEKGGLYLDNESNLPYGIVEISVL